MGGFAHPPPPEFMGFLEAGGRLEILRKTFSKNRAAAEGPPTQVSNSRRWRQSRPAWATVFIRTSGEGFGDAAGYIAGRTRIRECSGKV